MSPKRRHPRIELTIQVECVGDEVYFTDYARNLSEGGMCLQSRIPLRRGSEVDLRFVLPGDEGRAYSLRGEVVWIDPQTDAPLGSRPMGIRFQDAPTEDQERLRRELHRRLAPPIEN